MKDSGQSRINIGLGLAVLLFIVTTAISYRSTVRSSESAEWVAHTRQVLEKLEELISTLKEAEISQRGYIITGAERFLASYRTAISQIDPLFRDVRELTSDNPSQQRRFDLLQPLLLQKVNTLEEVIELRRRQGAEAAMQAIAGGVGQKEMDAARAVISEMKGEENRLLISREERSKAEIQKTTLALVVDGFIGLMIFFIVFYLFNRETIDRKKAERAMERANAKLTGLVAELEARKREMTLLSEMGELFQTCRTLQEADDIIAQFLRQLFPGESGALYLLMASRNMVELISAWGTVPSNGAPFPPDDCWALRRGQLHRVENVGSGLACRHVEPSLRSGSVCIPMIAQNDVLGVLQLLTPVSDKPDRTGEEEASLKRTKQELAVTVAEQIALSLSNLRLRETLRNQAIRDPLTGLFNRRYLEETLKQEISRADRTGQQIGVLMIDIDRFKQYNDTYGHEAGDAVLSELGRFLEKSLRGGDTPCRYGGEEFSVILPGTSLENALLKAERLREGVKALDVRYQGRSLGGINLSLGVAVFPDHGSTGEILLRAADQALYQAKAAGRDRVVAAGSPLGTLNRGGGGEPSRG